MSAGSGYTRTYHMTCLDCGMKYEAKTVVSVRCPECAQKHKKQYMRDYQHQQRLNKARGISANNKPKPCPYCGSPITKGDYCAECIGNGFSEVHKLTGKTNGWDAKPTEKVLLTPGWRGRRVIGAKSINKRGIYV